MAIDTANLYTAWRSRHRSGGGQYSTAVQAAFDNYDNLGDGLTDAEKTYMETYIDAEVANGNNDLKDNETIYSLSGTNALVDYINGGVSTAVGSPTQSVNGFSFNGTTQLINSNFTPSVSGVNYVLDNAQAGIFVFDDRDETPGANIDYINGGLIRVQRLGVGNFIRLNVNGGNNVIASGDTQSLDKKLIISSRVNATQVQAYIDGVANGNVADSSTSLASSDIGVGAQVTPSAFSDCTISAVIVSASIGFDHSAYNTNLRTLLTSLGVSL